MAKEVKEVKEVSGEKIYVSFSSFMLNGKIHKAKLDKVKGRHYFVVNEKTDKAVKEMIYKHNLDRKK